MELNRNESTKLGGPNICLNNRYGAASRNIVEVMSILGICCLASFIILIKSYFISLVKLKELTLFTGRIQRIFSRR